MGTKQKILIGIICAVVVCGGIGVMAMRGGGKDEEEEKEAVKEEVAEEEEEEPALLSLLTNEPVDDASLVENRPIAFMFENTKEALPHYGLSQAGIIYECPVEGGITRLMGLYDDYSDMDKIGCVRSARPYYAYLAKEYDAIFAHFGQSVHAEALLTSMGGSLVEDLNGLDGSLSSTYYRDSAKKAPHNAFSSTEGLDAGIEKKGYQRTYHDGYADGHFTFAEEENTLSDGEDCAVLTTYFPIDKPWFVYDEETKTYKRFEFGAEHVDAMNNEQLAVTNIIYEYVPSSLYGDTNAGYLNIPLTGSGEGKFFTNGKMIDITWSKESDTSPTKYYDTDGKEIELNTGKTWISLIENGSVGKNNYYATIEDYENR